MASLRGYDSSGRLIFDERSYAGNFLSSFNTGGQQTGTHTDARLIGKRLLYFAPQNLSPYGGPLVTLNASTGQVTWSYQVSVQGNGAPPVPSETIQYGGY